MIDEAFFFLSWLKKPLTTGAITASGKALSQAMASHAYSVAPHGNVLELGPGTGVITKTMLEKGFQENQITAIEYNNHFAKRLQQRYQGIKCLIGDAYTLHHTLSHHVCSSYDVIVSSLPLMAKSKKSREKFIHQALEHLTPQGKLIQFSYSLKPPVRSKKGVWTVKGSKWILMNIPPARIWIYERDEKKP